MQRAFNMTLDELIQQHPDEVERILSGAIREHEAS